MYSLELYFKNLSNIIWGSWLIITLFMVGIFFTVILKFIQLRHFSTAIRETIIDPLIRKKEIAGEGSISPFQALTTALGSCVGNGNIVGVATAIVGGGPGALFWMWTAGILGMATKYAEIVLGVHFREKGPGGSYTGGPMYYISKGLNLPILGFIYAGLLFLQNAGGTLIQSNAVREVIVNLFGLKPIAASLLLFIPTLLIINGGIKRLGSVTERLIPFMTSFYLLGGVVIICVNAEYIIPTLKLIISSAFNPQAGAAGVAGYSIKRAMRYGVARGLYSNEAGEGTAAVIHATAITDHPARQGLFGIIEVLVDTILICSVTGLVILISGVDQLAISPAIMISTAFSGIHWSLKYIVGISMILFGFSSVLAQWYFGTATLNFLAGEKKGNLYKYLFLFLIFTGPFFTLDLVWYIQDIFLGLLIIPNILGIILLSPVVRDLTIDFFTNYQKKVYSKERYIP